MRWIIIVLAAGCLACTTAQAPEPEPEPTAEATPPTGQSPEVTWWRRTRR